MIVHWFRHDLRLADNPSWTTACQAAQQHQLPVLPLFILDTHTNDREALGGASCWWS